MRNLLPIANYYRMYLHAHVIKGIGLRIDFVAILSVLEVMNQQSTAFADYLCLAGQEVATHPRGLDPLVFPSVTYSVFC